MYSHNKLCKLAHKIEKEYGHVVLCTEYKTALFHAHLENGIESLKRASNLLEKENDHDCEEHWSEGSLFAIFILMTFIMLILCLIY